MRQLTSKEIQTNIAVALAVTPRHVLAKLTNKLPTEADAARAELAARIAKLFHGDTVRVVQADLVLSGDHGSSPGKFGVDEPEPCPRQAADASGGQSSR